MILQKFHEIDENPETNKHLAEIIESISKNGWVGLPLLADGECLFNGCHRATACEILEIEPKIHQIEITCTWGDSPETDQLLSDLNGNESGDILQALKGLYDLGFVDKKSVDIMQAEYDHE